MSSTIPHRTKELVELRQLILFLQHCIAAIQTHVFLAPLLAAFENLCRFLARRVTRLDFQPKILRITKEPIDDTFFAAMTDRTFDFNATRFDVLDRFFRSRRIGTEGKVNRMEEFRPWESQEAV